MKKLMIAAAMAACATVGFADGDTSITSANIVGYSTVTIDKEYSLFAVNFQNPDGSNLSIQDIFKPCTGMTCAQAAGSADQIQIMADDGTYGNTSYFLSNGHYGKQGKYFNEAASNKWVSTTKATSPEPATATFKPGTAFFYVSPGAKAGNSYTVQIAGGVSRAEKETYEINKSYTLLGCPFPCDVALNGGIEVSDSTMAQAAGSADQIQIMASDGTYGNTSYFLSNGHYGKQGKYFNEAASNKWVSTTKATSPEPTTDTFPCGLGGFFVSQKQTGTLKFVNPIK